MQLFSVGLLLVRGYDVAALRAEVLDLCEESRDLVVAEGHVEAVRLHDRFARFCEDHLQPQNTSQHAHETLEKACAVEATMWDKHERGREEEVHMLTTVLTLLGGDTGDPRSLVQADATVRVEARRLRGARGQEVYEGESELANITAAGQARICDVDLGKMKTLRSALERKVNQTSNATVLLKNALDSRSDALQELKHGAHAEADRAAQWEAGYVDQEAQLGAEGDQEQGDSQAVHLGIDMLVNFYAQRHASLPGDPDLEEMGVEPWREELTELWPSAPPIVGQYGFHRELVNEVIVVLRSLGSLLESQVRGTHVVEEAVRGEARRVRGYRTTAAHNAREQIAKLKLDLKDDDQALVALRERLHTEQGELASVDEKLAQLQALCEKMQALVASPNATRAAPSPA